jgi:pentatricopeptide repeat protein
VIAYSLARSGETEEAIHAFKELLQTMPAEIKAD